MPELPDIAAYLTAIDARCEGGTLAGIRLGSPFLLRTLEPGIAEFAGRRYVRSRRIGKRIALGFEGELWAVLHLMIAGRLHWQKAGAKLVARRGLAAFDFAAGSLVLTEAGSKKRASLHLFRGDRAVEMLDPGGLEPLEATFDAFAARLRSANHTLKRSLTDPRLFSGIGNAYSDEILHHAGLSPVLLTQKMDDAAVRRLYESTREVLRLWMDRFSAEAAAAFPEKVTAFRPEMAVHGKFGQPCPRCQAPVQRIRYADNETNYCAGCQTGGRLLADRSLSRLLKEDWPRTLEELEHLHRR